MQKHCLSWTKGNQGDSEEALSRVASTVFFKFSSRRNEIADVRAWLLRLTYNACMDLHRERKRRGEQSLEDIEESAAVQSPCQGAQPFGTPESCFLEAELAGYLRSRIGELPPKLQDALRLRMDQHSYTDIAARLSIKEAAARKRVQLARQVLQLQLREYLEGRSPAPGRRTEPGRRAGFTPSRSLRPSGEPIHQLACEG